MDMISNLHPNIIEAVLCFLPIQEAARTSILLREWRYRWNKIPKLVFEEAKFQVSYDVAESSVVEQTVNGSSNRQIMFRRKKFFSAISQAVLMHEGPIHEFALFMLPDDEGVENHTCVEIDCIIFHLSRKHTVKKLTIDFEYGIYKLPYSLFSFSHLSNLSLVGCSFSHKPTFNEFRRLTSLSLDGVYISRKTLLHLLSSCPLLKNVTLEIDGLYILIRSDESTTIINLFESLRMIESLSIPFSILESFVHDRTPRELPALLSHLKYFYTHEIPFTQKVGLSFLVFLIRNSPNLEKVEIDNYELEQDDSSMEDDLCTEDELYSFTVDSYSDIWLEHLKEVHFKGFKDWGNELNFVKLILAKSPVLKKVKITLDYSVFDEDEVLQILQILLSFPRASPVVEIII